MTGTMKPSPTRQVDEGVSDTLMFLGIALIVLGMVAVVLSALFTIGTVMICGGLLVAAGIVEFIHACKAHGRKRVFLNIVSSLLYLLAGGIILFNPVAGALSLTLVISVFLLVAGVIRCAYGITHREQRTWGWFVFGGLVDIALGAFITLGWPATGLWVIGLFIGIEMLMYGFTMTMLSIEFKNMEHRLTG